MAPPSMHLRRGDASPLIMIPSGINLIHGGASMKFDRDHRIDLFHPALEGGSPLADGLLPGAA